MRRQLHLKVLTPVAALAATLALAPHVVAGPMDSGPGVDGEAQEFFPNGGQFTNYENIKGYQGGTGGIGTDGPPGEKGPQGKDGESGRAYGDANSLPPQWVADGSPGGTGGIGGLGGNGSAGGSGGQGVYGNRLIVYNEESGNIAGGVGGTGGTGGTGGKGGMGGQGGNGGILEAWDGQNVTATVRGDGGPGGAGGNGGDGGNGGNGGNGGAGISGTNLGIVNAGTITGGNGGLGGAGGAAGLHAFAGAPGYGYGTSMPPDAPNGWGGIAGMAGADGNGGPGIALTGGSDNVVTNTPQGRIFGGAGGGATGTGGDGILVSGGQAIIVNMGTITGGLSGAQGGFSYGVRVTGGTVSLLVNAQGGNTPLTYRGALPQTYQVVVQSPDNYGRLVVTSPSGRMAFGIEESSTPTIGTTYTAVLEGMGSEALESVTGASGDFGWTLLDPDNDLIWDLRISALGPDAANTLLGLQANSNAVRSVLSQRAAMTSFALDNDCSVFDTYGLCVSVGFRTSQIGSEYNDNGETAGILSFAYRVTPELRIGGFIDQSLTSNTPVGVDAKNTQPMLGAFAVYQENANFSGLTVRAGLAYQQGDLRITRPLLENTEAGTGTARTTAMAFGAELAYGFPIDDTWVAQPYGGIRRTDSQRRGYTEGTSEAVEFPITYSRYGQVVTSATAGLRLRGAITPEFSLTFGAGVEYDLNSKMDSYAGTSAIPGLESFSIAANQQQNELRGVGTAGMRYMIAANQALAVDTSIRQLPYGNDPAISTMLRYSFGF